MSKSKSPRFFRPNNKRTLTAELLELHIEQLSHDGRGIARHRGKTVFVSNALPDETVRVRISESKSRFDQAETLEVLSASDKRVEPPCPHYRRCGGCELQHLDADEQIQQKQQLALEQLKRSAGIAPKTIKPPLTGSPWHYRRKTRLSIYCPKKKSEPVLGFRRKQSKELIPVQQCPVLESQAEALLPPLQRWLKASTNPQALGHIELITGDNDAALILRHMQPIAEPELSALQEIADTAGFTLLLQPRGPDSLHRYKSDNSPVRLHFALPAFGLELAFHPNDFIQVNAELNRSMVTQAMTWLNPKPGERILELFSGLGNFSLPMAKSGAEIIAIEGSETMVQRGEENARQHQLSNVQFHCADLNQDQSHRPWFGQGFDKVLLDPPRSGAQEVITQLAKYAIPTVLYVSCDPATLARDAKLLAEQGYQLECWGVMNMFPHTSHVESMALFKR